MSFKENLKKKILMVEFARTVRRSIGAPGKFRKVDKDSMRQLLDLGPFVLEKRRDLDLYFRTLDAHVGEVLVLDNELPLYENTTLDDVVLRRSPVLKEMISVRNIIKILNDNDILKCKGTESVDYVRDRGLDMLDLRYQRKDIEEMADDGAKALARADSEDVEDILALFVEVLGYETLPEVVTANDFIMFGQFHGKGGPEESIGPVIMYNDRTNVLRLIRQRISLSDSIAKALIPDVAQGRIKPDAEEFQVFQFLQEEVLKRQGPTIH